MNLTQDEFDFGKQVAEECLIHREDCIDSFIKESLESFMKNLILSKISDRNKIYEFLNHIRSLLMNYQINGEMYLLGDKEKNRANIGVKSIVQIINSYQNSGL